MNAFQARRFVLGALLLAALQGAGCRVEKPPRPNSRPAASYDRANFITRVYPTSGAAGSAMFVTTTNEACSLQITIGGQPIEAASTERCLGKYKLAFPALNPGTYPLYVSNGFSGSITPTSNVVQIRILPGLGEVKAVWEGTTKLLRVWGSGLSHGNFVIGGQVVNTIAATQASAELEWPATLAPGSYDVGFRDRESGFAAKPARIEVVPQSYNVFPANVSGGETVTLEGLNLAFQGKFPMGSSACCLFEGALDATLVTASPTIVRFIMPEQIWPGPWRSEMHFEFWTDANDYAGAILVWPSITDVFPAAVTSGGTLTVRGRNFGLNAGDAQAPDYHATISVNGVQANIQEWYPTVITFTVPATTATGTAQIRLRPWVWDTYLYPRETFAVAAVTIDP